MAKSAVDGSTPVQLSDGTPVVVRAIEPDDATDLIRAHDSLSDEARRLRFFRPHPRLSEDEARYFTTVDHVDREAFVVLVDDRIIAVGRYDRVEPEVAEVAFVVGDDWQSHGIATLLLNRLADRAIENGITRFIADTFGDNNAMLAVFRHWAPNRKVSIDSGFLHVEMLIPHDEV
jgi:RimJ/RimL family protein N-acetyltransferase